MKYRKKPADVPFAPTVITAKAPNETPWADCPYCGQSCTGSYGGAVRCIRCWENGRRNLGIEQ